MDSSILYPNQPSFMQSSALNPAAKAGSALPSVPSATSAAPPTAPTTPAPVQSSGTAPPPAAAGIDYSKYAGVSPYDLQTRLMPNGLPTNWSWDEWMKVNPGAPDPRIYSNTGDDTRLNGNLWDAVGGYMPPALQPAGASPSVLKGGSGAPTVGSATPRTAAPSNALPQNMSPYGTYGNLSRFVGTAGQDTSMLPDWLRSQLQFEGHTDEGGTQSGYYNWNQNPWGGYKGQDGKYYVQMGDPSSWKAGDQDGGVKDPSKVTYDPNLGYVTTADNLHDSGIGGVDWRMVAAAIGGGLALGAVGAGAGAGGAFTGGGWGVGAEIGTGAGAGAGAGAGLLEPLTPVTLGPEPTFLTPTEIGGAGSALTPLTPVPEPTLPPQVPFSPDPLNPTVPPLTNNPQNPLEPMPPEPTTPTPPGTPPVTPTTPPTPPGTPSFNPSSLINPAARILGPLAINRIINGTHPGSTSGTGTPSVPGTGTGTGGTGTSGNGSAMDALRQSLIDNKPLTDAARATLLNGGKPTDDQAHAIDSTIDQQRRISREQILQNAANSGQGNSGDSMLVQDKLAANDRALDTQKFQMYQQQAQQNTTTALSELGFVSQETLALATLQFQEDQATQQLWTGIFEAIASLYGGTSGAAGAASKLPIPNITGGDGGDNNQTPTSITDENGTPVDPHTLEPTFDP